MSIIDQDSTLTVLNGMASSCEPLGSLAARESVILKDVMVAGGRDRREGKTAAHTLVVVRVVRDHVD